MVELLEDKLGGADTTGHTETVAWNALLLHLRLQDVFYLDEFRKLTPRRSTWDNRQKGAESILSSRD